MKEFNLLKKFNWQEASKPTIKKYVADLRQSGTDAPALKTLFNDADITFTSEYIDNGTYAIIASKPLFVNCGMGCPPQDVQVNITNSSYIGNTAGPSGYSIVNFAVDAYTIILLTSNLVTTTDSILGNGSQNALEITIYNQ